MALFAAYSLSGEGKTYARWRLVFVFIGAAALLGAVHHGLLESIHSVSGYTWAAITILVAISISFVLAATISTVLGEGRGKVLLTIRTASLGAFLVLAALGHAAVSTLVITEGATMLVILWLWAMALWRKQPGVLLIVAAIAVSGVGGIVRNVPIHMDIGGWDFGGVAWFHIMQTLGIVLLFVGVQGWGYRQAGSRKIADSETPSAQPSFMLLDANRNQVPSPDWAGD